jgi:hypothetical protein
MHSFCVQTVDPDEDTGMCVDLWAMIDTTGKSVADVIVDLAGRGLRVIHVMPVPFVAFEGELPS